VLIQSASAAGKTALMDALLAMIPDDERVLYSAVTGQALFYLGETDLAHKLLAIAEDEGVSRAGYALKLLQSEGVLTIASTGKDPTTGRLTTQTYRVQGPVMLLLLTTTAPELDEELRNRLLKAVHTATHPAATLARPAAPPAGTGATEPLETPTARGAAREEGAPARPRA
jgi:DNA primase